MPRLGSNEHSTRRAPRSRRSWMVSTLSRAVLLLAAVASHGDEQPESIESGPPTGPIQIEVDATAVHRHLLKSELVFRVEPGEQAFWYPNWIPGIHGQTEQIANVAGVMFSDDEGNVITWRRDPTNLNRFMVKVPEGVETLKAKLVYLANQPTDRSASVESYGTQRLIAINFNTCVLYQEGAIAEQTPVSVRVRVPKGWGVGSAMATGELRSDGLVDLGHTTLQRLIDSPMIAGKYHNSIEVEGEGVPSTTLQLVADEPSQVRMPRDRVEKVSGMMQEACALVGSAPFKRYSFLIVCSERVPRFGLEHADSSLNSIRSTALQDESLYEHRPAYLLPHELMHAWCGKYRVPIEMLSDNYHTPLNTELLWVYEGLTQYLMQLVAVRSGQVSFEEHLEYLAYRVSDQMQRSGREWRSLSDTALAARTLRGGPGAWRDLRRGQDYYGEGALFWLNVDCLLREKSDDRVSIDDFCKRFLGTDTMNPTPKGYDLDEIVETLNNLVPDDWAGLIRKHVYTPSADMEMGGIYRAGYRLDWVNKKPDYIRRREEILGDIQAIDSLGMSVSSTGKIRRVVPDSASDKASLRTNAEIVAVNRRAYSSEVFEEEVAATSEGDDEGSIELIVREDDTFSIHTVEYSEGIKHAVLTPREDAPDRLQDIFAPTVERNRIEETNDEPGSEFPSPVNTVRWE